MVDMTFELTERDGDEHGYMILTRDTSSSLVEILRKSYKVHHDNIVGWTDNDSVAVEVMFNPKMFPTYDDLRERIYKQTMFALPPHETDENRARFYFHLPYTPTPAPEPDPMPRHNKLRIRKTLYAYELVILREPGEKFIFGSSEKIVEGIDEKQRTVWVRLFADQFEAWNFFREAVGTTLLNSNRKWELRCKGKLLNFQLGQGMYSLAALDKLTNAWLAMYPDMPMQQVIHRVFHGRRAGWLPENIDYRRRAEMMHERYQKVTNDFNNYKIQQVFSRNQHYRVQPSSVPETTYQEALRVILEQFIRSCAAAHQHTNVSKLYAVGPRYRPGKLDAGGFLNALQYFGTDAATAVEYLRTWYSQHYYGGAYERSFCLYEIDLTREPAVLVEVQIQEHEKIAKYARLTPRPAAQ